VPVTDPNWYFSPFNWDDNGGGALQANNIRAGSGYAVTSNLAYFCFSVVSGSGAGSIDLLLNTSDSFGTAQKPNLTWSVDGGTLGFAQPAGSTSTVDVPLASGLSAGTHTLHFWVKGIGFSVSGLNRWIGPTNCVKVIGLQLDANSVIAPYPFIRPFDAIFYGDSQIDGGTSDVTVNWPEWIGWAMNCNIGNSGWFGTGWTLGNGEAPQLFTPGNPTNSSWWQVNSVRSRLTGSSGVGTFVRQPKYIFAADDHNDGATNSSANVLAAMTAWRAAAPNARIVIIAEAQQTGLTHVVTGYNAYKATNPSDLKTTLVQYGNEIVNPVQNNDLGTGGHPNSKGQAAIGAMTAYQVALDEAALGTPAPAIIINRNRVVTRQTPVRQRVVLPVSTAGQATQVPVFIRRSRSPTGPGYIHARRGSQVIVTSTPQVIGNVVISPVRKVR
jgi:hypothetical protein